MGARSWLFASTGLLHLLLQFPVGARPFCVVPFLGFRGISVPILYLLCATMEMFRLGHLCAGFDAIAKRQEHSF
jgi:hypothetical protein